MRALLAILSWSERNFEPLQILIVPGLIFLAAVTWGAP